MVLASILMIFFFSSKNGEESGELSNGTLENIVGSFVEEERVPEVVDKLHTPFRKIAHFGIYMLLGFSLSCAFILSIPLKPLLSCAFALGSGVIYALIDEFVFQQITSGRGPSIVDALVYDGLGVLTGAFVYFVFNYFNSRYIIKNRN